MRIVGMVAIGLNAAVLLLATPIGSLANDAACKVLGTAGVFANTKVESAVVVPARDGLPAYCEVSATITPVERSRIGVMYRLPDDWNGKVLGLGGGGWAGNISLASAAPGLRRGYATMQTDTGHPIASAFDTRWATDAQGRPDRVAIEDFGYRAVHEMTRVGKQIAAAYYKKPHRQAYWQGCSTGGRQGLMEVQRFPADYDGVIAGAPVYDLLTTTGALLRYNNFAAPERRLTAGHLERINRSVLKACDSNDGVADGIVIDPRTCDWDPGELLCPSGASGEQCLTAGQVDAVRLAYRGVRTKSGSIAAHPLSRGSELGWTRFHSASGGPPGDAASVGMNGLRAAFFGDPDYDLTRFDADRDVQRVRESAFASTYEATRADLTAFVRRGGKLIMWHGFYDPGPGPLGTIEYYEQVLRATQSMQGVTQSVRLFLAPGVAHCGGGPGPDQIDFLSALEQWVERGEPPDEIAAMKKGSELSWAVCAYPAMPRGRESMGYECRR